VWRRAFGGIVSYRPLWLPAYRRWALPCLLPSPSDSLRCCWSRCRTASRKPKFAAPCSSGIVWKSEVASVPLPVKRGESAWWGRAVLTPTSCRVSPRWSARFPNMGLPPMLMERLRPRHISMRSLDRAVREIASAVLLLLQTGGGGALATVVQTRGSVPQQPGARLLWRQEGPALGTVGGGAIEALVLEQLEEVFRLGTARLLRTDLTRDLG